MKTDVIAAGESLSVCDPRGLENHVGEMPDVEGAAPIRAAGNADVQAMSFCVLDFIPKTIGHSEPLASVRHILTHSLLAWGNVAAERVASLTSRQRQIMKLVLGGRPSKNIAVDLGVSQRTVENHRAAIMKKTGAKSIPALVLLGVAAGWNIDDEPLVQRRFRPSSSAAFARR